MKIKSHYTGSPAGSDPGSLGMTLLEIATKAAIDHASLDRLKADSLQDAMVAVTLLGGVKDEDHLRSK